LSFYELWGSCHWIAPFVIALAKKAYPNKRWVILRGEKHTIVIDYPLTTVMDMLNFKTMTAKGSLRFAFDDLDEDNFDDKNDKNNYDSLLWEDCWFYSRNILIIDTPNEYIVPPRKPVIQLTKDGKFVHRYNSATEAADLLNLSRCEILSRAQRGHRSEHLEFIWLFEEDYKDKRVIKFLKSAKYNLSHTEILSLIK